MPCCGDGLSAKLIQRAKFDFTFMSGFATAGSKGLPDTGLLSYKEMLENVAETSDVIDIPLIADADTGFGNAVNVRRTVMGFAKAGASGLLIEDQVNPKRYRLTHSVQSPPPEMLTVFSSANNVDADTQRENQLLIEMKLYVVSVQHVMRETKSQMAMEVL